MEKEKQDKVEKLQKDYGTLQVQLGNFLINALAEIVHLNINHIDSLSNQMHNVKVDYDKLMKGEPKVVVEEKKEDPIELSNEVK